jgi:hypothetical protein
MTGFTLSEDDDTDDLTEYAYKPCPRDPAECQKNLHLFDDFTLFCETCGKRWTLPVKT